MQTPHSFLWFDDQAEEAANMYSSIFPGTKIGKTARYSESAAQASGRKPGSVMTIDFEIFGHRIGALNGGPLFQFTPALSFFVWCDSEQEIETYWQKLANGGHANMALDKYPWAKKYGWTSDKFGMQWQLILNDQKPSGPKIAPAFLFANKNFGKGEEAIRHYQSLFDDSQILMMTRDEERKIVQHSIFTLNGQKFVLMEGPGEFTFNESFSFVVNCDTQEEIDRCWNYFTREGKASRCGWLVDKYGVSWQIIPSKMGTWASDPKRGGAVMAEVLKMTKLDLKALQKAYEG